MRRSVAVPLFLAALAVMGSGCSREDEGPRVPLGSTPAAQQSSTLNDRSRAALAEGNAEFRAKRFEQALDAYRRAAAESPQDVAPLWGIQMTAKAMGNTTLADSAVERMRTIAPGAAPLTGQDPHAGFDTTKAALPPNHPVTSGSATTPPVSGQ